MTKPQPRPWSDSDNRFLRQLILQGMSVPVIAKKRKRTEKAVAAYKNRQGISAAVVREEVPGTSMRPCMCCRTVFASQGKHNRLCDPCRGRTAETIYGFLPK